MVSDGEKERMCSFFGHRSIDVTEELRQKVSIIISELIVKREVTTFLFGSRSNFVELCHTVIDELKQVYPNIKRIAYTCKGEACILESERVRWEGIYAGMQKKNMRLLCVDEEYEHKTKFCSGKAGYVERNRAMIDDSDYCIFFYDECYKPKMRRYSKHSLGYYQPKSGTRLAYEYANKKCKNVINVFEK